MSLKVEAWLLAGALIFSLVLQQTLMRLVAVGSVMPDLPLILLVGISLRHGSLPGLVAGFSLGMIQDVYAYETLGAQILAKSVVGYGIGFFNDRVIKVMPATRVILLGVAFAVHDFLAALASGLKGDSLADALLRQSLPSGIYTLLVGAGLFYLWSMLTGREP